MRVASTEHAEASALTPTWKGEKEGTGQPGSASLSCFVSCARTQGVPSRDGEPDWTGYIWG